LTLFFQFPGETNARLSVYDLLGKEVLAIEDERILTGRNEMRIDISGLKSGLYFIKLKTHEGAKTEKIVVH